MRMRIPRMREVRRIFSYNCDKDEESQDERGAEDLYLYKYDED
jgi:hypothetical protein